MKKKQRTDFNYSIAKVFLNNTRLMILTLLLLILVGLIATFSLKSTGFPNPSINVAQVLTIYPGASSETMLKTVTQPLESAVKSVDGVKSYSSSSQDSVSSIVVTIDEKANTDTVKTKLDSAVKSVTLPEGVQTPKIVSFQVGGPDYILSIASKDISKVYEVTQRLTDDLNQIPETSSVDPLVELKKNVVVKLNLKKMKDYGITMSDVTTQLQSVGESLPVVSDVSIDKTNQTIITSVSGTNLRDIENTRFQVIKQLPPKIVSIKFSLPTFTMPPMPTPSVSVTPTATPKPTPTTPPLSFSMPVMQAPQVKTYYLKQFATINISYKFAEQVNTVVGLNDGATPYQLSAVTLLIKGVNGVDSAKYSKAVQDAISQYNDIVYVKEGTQPPAYSDSKVFIVEDYSINNANKSQINEVISGLIGGPLPIKNEKIAQIGWLLGGIQLVVLAMMLLVSWRAALVSALAIPLSLLFSSIYLYFSGYDMNTLVLFSLVLVIGLVVDPALVMLESLQRKIDIGMTGIKAALAAVQDIGLGLFLAALTDIIVFAPFGVISGVMGEIFKFIPITVIPALVGSYIVPLIFLSWVASKFLKKSKNAGENEIDNLPSIAKGLINVNRSILNSPRWVRILIIVFSLFVIPVFVAGYYFSTGKIKQVSFATQEDSANLQINGSFKTNLTVAQKQEATKKALSIITANKYVEAVYPVSSGMTYYVNIKPKADREEGAPTSLAIAKDLNDKLQAEGKDYFYDITADVISNGPPTAAYDVTISIKSPDLQKLKTGALSLGETLRKACLSNNKVTFPDNCDGTKVVAKVDDGFTGKESKVVEIVLDRNTLVKNMLFISNTPVGYYVNSQIKQNFVLNNDKKAGTVEIDGEQLDIVLENAASDPSTIKNLKELKVTSLEGKDYKLKDIATVKETASKTVIQRLKGQTYTLVQARLADGYRDQTNAGIVTNAIVNYYTENDSEKAKQLGLGKASVQPYSEGGSAMFAKSFQELLIALVLAIFLTYFVFVLFFQSFTLPLVIVLTIPLTFVGAFPALAYLGTGELGFLEIIGIIILVGIVENVAIFLLDATRQRLDQTDEDEKEAIAKASGIRFRPILLTKVVTSASLLPLVLFSQFYRNMSLVLIFGLLASGFTSLITTPILYIFFRWMSRKFRALNGWHRLLFIVFWPIYLIVWGIRG